MNIAHSMCYVIQRARSLAEILDGAVELIAREMGTDVCSIYLLDPRDHRLRLMATRGLDPGALGKVALALGEGLTGTVVKEMRSLAVEDASRHPGYRYFPETKEEQFQSYLGVPLAIQRRPVGAIVVQTRERRSYSPEEVATLTAISAQLVGVVENARLIDALDRGEEGLRYLREVRSWRSLGQMAPEGPKEDRVLAGAPASAGIAIGAAVFCGSYDTAAEPDDAPPEDEETEWRRVEAAFDQTRRDILRIRDAAEREAGEEHAMVFSSHILLLNDPVLLERIRSRVGRGEGAYRAIHAELEHFSAKLRNVADPYIQDRVEDIGDLRSRILGRLANRGARSSPLGDKIAVSRGIPPSLVVELKAEGARGIITERGGPTSHGMLLARSMGLPAVTGILDAVLLVRTGDTLIIDGDTGKVIVCPSAETLRLHEEVIARAAARKAESLAYRKLPARSRDGVDVTIQANVGVWGDLQAAVENGAQGVGLYRTELAFIIREDIPTGDEQARIYAKAYDFFPRGPINFRLLDLGGDKFIARETLGAERNPFRGFRSIRVLLANPDVLRTQVKAFARAAGERPLSILIPMVSSLPELREAIAHIREAASEVPELRAPPRIGAMIEVPAAVELAGEMAAECDFLSIGSNDLAQYTLAIDRENASAATPGDAFHPAILRLIRRTIEAGHSRGKPVSICGEMAADRRLAVLLVAMGIDSLSVAPASIAELKRFLAGVDIGLVRDHTGRILSLGEAAEVERELERHVPAEAS